TIQTVSPAPGAVNYLTNITVIFTEPVSGVNATDLLINGNAASTVTAIGNGNANSNAVYTFSLAQPNYGAVNISWASGHGIADFDNPPKPFNATAAGSTWQYSLLNPNSPV